MKRDVQVGVVLGVIILAIIGVFLSTRTAVKEPAIPIPEVEEDSKMGLLDITDLSKETKDSAITGESINETAETVQNKNIGQTKTEAINAIKTEEQSIEKKDNVVEGTWNRSESERPINVVVSENKEVISSQGEEEFKDIDINEVQVSSSKLRVHKVQQNDSLYKIANKYYRDESKWLLIFNANRDKLPDRNSLKIGTELFIPEEKTIIQSTKEETTIPTLMQMTEVEDTKSSRRHTIQKGDSLYKIALQYYKDGSKWNKILEVNSKIIKNQSSLPVGAEIEIPGF
ncbi:MAG TPA: LysM peptidoglycan-binding domain-containing protein [Candidatus Wujingus californicus]|uniref:LysM peptidoglycan-binding domain-containing protein n=2 Tax=Candidatus Wujingus californicus TaxID=3367618 RepID=UPI001E111C2B|nr:LysM peptidoglycan-binding domain-containing protein [Planctomycetota bacterium]MDO8130820.1 LysM peptidoglycan-binding domain-containing protein [Candidatus Brocadiales bacterium]